MQKELKTDFRRQDKWLTFAVLLGPLSSLTNLTVSYSLVPESCMRGTKLLLHASAGVFLVLCALGAWIAWRVGMRFTLTRPAADRLEERTHWLGLAGVVLSVFSALVIVAMEIPNVILRSCD